MHKEVESMDTRLKNGKLTLTVSAKGAEIKSLIKSGREVMWSGNPAYWSRTAPVLFPFVGASRGKKYRVGGAEYPMGQHGFARDEEFELVRKSQDQLVYELKDTEKTRSIYPFSFILRIEYTLTSSAVGVRYEVTNPSGTPLYFSIGGHPAFVCPFDAEGGEDYKLRFMKEGLPVSALYSCPVTEEGLIRAEAFPVECPDGYLVPSRKLFLGDALVLEEQQADRVSLIGPDGEYLRVDFDTPVLGIWSPKGLDAPFVCIEPWYGRADGDTFEGDITEKAYGNVLNGGETFGGGYTITVL